MSDYAVKITEAGKERKRREAYIGSIEIGDIIAFKISENAAVSAKVYEFVKGGDVLCVTKNSIKYRVPPRSIVWVKTGSKWPQFVMNLFSRKSGRN